MSKLTRIALTALAAACTLGFVHAWLNLGFDPLRAVGLRRGPAEPARFRVGFLPVT